MQTYRLHVSNARDSVLEIRSELFAFPEVLEVFAPGRPDVLVVVCSGRPRPTQWLRTLRAAGYEPLVRRVRPRRSSAAQADPHHQDVVAQLIGR